MNLWSFQLRACIDESDPELSVFYQYHLGLWPPDQWEGRYPSQTTAEAAAIPSLRDAIRQKQREDKLAADLQEALLRAPLPEGVGLVVDPDCTTVLDDKSAAYFQQWKPFLEGNPAYGEVQYEGGVAPEYTPEDEADAKEALEELEREAHNDEG